MYFYSGTLFLFVGIISTLSVPLLLKYIIDSFSNSEKEYISWALVGYGLVWIISQASLHLRSLFTSHIEQRITFALGNKVLSHLYTLSQNYFLRQKPGALANIIRRAQQNVPPIILGIFFHVLPTVLEFLFVLALIIICYPFIYSLLLASILFTFFAYTMVSMRCVIADRQTANDVDQNTDGIVTDWLSNHEAIKIFGKHEFATEICKQELKKREAAEVKFMTRFSFARLGQSLILGIGLLLVTFFVGMKVVSGELTIGDFILFNGYIIQLMVPINILGQITHDIKKSILDLKGVIEIFFEKNEVIESLHPLHLEGSAFCVEFKNVTFNYMDRNILENISFTIEAGKTVLIAGPTGIGKSTLAKLLLRLYNPTSGDIFINHINIKDISFRSLYETIGWVPQETYFLNDSIYNNLQFIQPEASREDIELALEKACLLEFIKCLPQGIHTAIGNRGLKLSGGEKQRLAIARLFLKNPKVCIFDESTSGLDRDTELQIQANIETFLPHMTKLIITHRPFMLKKADKIIRLDENKYSQDKSTFNWEELPCANKS
nr:ABC transporter ATP-binding protein [Candidatus Odyssella thessalonicensis]